MLLVQQNEDLKIKASPPEIQPEFNHCHFLFKFLLLQPSGAVSAGLSNPRAYFIGKTEPKRLCLVNTI